MKLETMIQNLSNEELETCYFEYAFLRKNGSLPKDTIIRKMWDKYREINRAFPISAMGEPILFEIAKRKYEKRASVDDTIEITANSNSHQFEIGQLVKVVEWNKFEKDDDFGVEATDGKTTYSS